MKYLIIILIIFSFSLYAQHSELPWGTVIDTYPEWHTGLGGGAGDTSMHFDTTHIIGGGFNGNDVIRWTVKSETVGEQGDGFWFEHPDTDSNRIYIGFAMRWGSTLLNAMGTEPDYPAKFVMFYNTSGTNPRPTIFMDDIVTGGSGTYTQLTADLAAGGNGNDEFNEGALATNYPDHTFKIQEDSAATQWYWIVAGIEADSVNLWVYSQDGTLSGGAQGNDYFATSISIGSLDMNQTWRWNQLMSYVEQTGGGDANSWIEFDHCINDTIKPSIPDGFLTGSGGGSFAEKTTNVEEIRP